MREEEVRPKESRCACRAERANRAHREEVIHESLVAVAVRQLGVVRDPRVHDGRARDGDGELEPILRRLETKVAANRLADPDLEVRDRVLDVRLRRRGTLPPDAVEERRRSVRRSSDEEAVVDEAVGIGQREVFSVDTDARGESRWSMLEGEIVGKMNALRVGEADGLFLARRAAPCRTAAVLPREGGGERVARALGRLCGGLGSGRDWSVGGGGENARGAGVAELTARSYRTSDRAVLSARRLVGAVISVRGRWRRWGIGLGERRGRGRRVGRDIGGGKRASALSLVLVRRSGVRVRRKDVGQVGVDRLFGGNSKEAYLCGIEKVG